MESGWVAKSIWNYKLIQQGVDHVNIVGYTTDVTGQQGGMRVEKRTGDEDWPLALLAVVERD